MELSVLNDVCQLSQIDITSIFYFCKLVIYNSSNIFWMAPNDADLHKIMIHTGIVDFLYCPEKQHTLLYSAHFRVPIQSTGASNAVCKT